MRDKEILKDIIEAIAGMSDFSIEEVIEFADQKGICKKDDKYYKFLEGNPYIYNRVKKVKFTQFQYLFYYLEGHTPFSTQHKIKGTQFDNVLVILDNGNWSHYNFEYLFNNRTDKVSVLSRTQKIFYVCCTRAKEKLAVFYHNPSSSVITKAKLWFGESNVVEV